MSLTKTLTIGAVVLSLVCVGGSATFAETCGKFKLVVGFPVIDLDPADFEELAEHFGIENGFEWCWSQPVKGSVVGEWVFCGSTHEEIYKFDPFGFGYDSELYGNPGMITSENGDIIYTMTYSMAYWDFEIFEAIAVGGITRYTGATGDFSTAAGWTSDRPTQNPPSFKVKAVGTMCRAE